MNANSKMYVVVLSVAIICAVFFFCYWVSLQSQIGSSVVVTTSTPSEEMNNTVIAWRLTCTHCGSIMYLHNSGFAVHPDDIYKCYSCGFEGAAYQFDVDISRYVIDAPLAIPLYKGVYLSRLCCCNNFF
jgi:predicted RNA-binding Zn-ribbon protein involved in translation (DUF1610 family)